MLSLGLPISDRFSASENLNVRPYSVASLLCVSIIIGCHSGHGLNPSPPPWGFLRRYRLRGRVVCASAQHAADDWLHKLHILSTVKVFKMLSEGSSQETVGSPSLSFFSLLGHRQGRCVFYVALR